MFAGDVLTTSKISTILEVLSDEKWHRLAVIQRRTRIDKDDVLRIIEFLSKYEFVVMDQRKERIRLNEAAKFLAQTSIA